jgi:hypothetical protein
MSVGKIDRAGFGLFSLVMLASSGRRHVGDVQ